MKDSIINILKINKFTYSYLLYIKYLLLKKTCSKNRKTNVFMLHTGRVGSTVLADLLNQHSKIHWDGEFYIKKDKKHLNFIHKNSITFLKIKANQRIIESYGFEVKSSPKQIYGTNSINLNLDEFLEKIQEINFKHFILLERKNYLKQFISFKFAKKTKILHTKQKTEKLNTLLINVENCLWFKEEKNLIKHFEYLDNFYENTKNKIKNKKHLFLTYEDDILKNPTIAYKKTCDLLGLEHQNPKVNLKRTNPFPLKDVIENYIEVEEYLKGTKYEWMLYD